MSLPYVVTAPATHRAFLQVQATKIGDQWLAYGKNECTHLYAAYSSDRDAGGSATTATFLRSKCSNQEWIQPFASAFIDAHIGVRGIGFDYTMPVSQSFNGRGAFVSFSLKRTSNESGVQVASSLSLRSRRLDLDSVPWYGGFLLNLDLQFCYHSSFANCTAVGFYYLCQPKLPVSFSSSIVDPSQSATPCQNLSTLPSFKDSLSYAHTGTQPQLCVAFAPFRSA